jgi:hypothetical protein
VVADSSTDAAAGTLAGGAILGIILLAIFYLLPTVIAFLRKCRNTGPVVIINIFLGWTFIGWVVALAMAFGQTRDEQYGTQVVQVFSPGHTPIAAPAGGPTLSPDGRYWWDGTAWRDTGFSVPPSAPRSEDGHYWWDGARWRSVPA